MADLSRSPTISSHTAIATFRGHNETFPCAEVHIWKRSGNLIAVSTVYVGRSVVALSEENDTIPYYTYDI